MSHVTRIAILGLVISSTSAAADIEVYGQAHLALSYLDDGGEYSALNLSSNSSRLGFRAGNDFSPRLRGLIQLEGQVDFDSDSDEAPSLSSRDSYLGLTGGWGLLRAGYISTPVKDIRSRVVLFTDQLGDPLNIIRINYTLDAETLEGFDQRFRNSIAYRTPVWQGFAGDVHYSVESENRDTAEDGNDNQAWSATISYQYGAAFLAVGHERWEFASEAAGQERELTRLAGYFDLGLVRVSGLAQTASDPDDNAYGIGARYALNPHLHLKGHYFHLDADNSDYDANLLAVGVDYLYAPELTWYLNYAQIMNADLQDRGPWNQGSTLSQPASQGDTARGLALGVMYSF